MRRIMVLSALLFLFLFPLGPAAAQRPEPPLVIVAPGGDAAVFHPGREEIAYLGVRLAEVDAETVQELNLPEERGARVVDVEPGSPADRAGLRVDDVIVRWNDRPIESARQLRRLVRETPPGRTVRLGILREGKEQTVVVKLGHRRVATWEPFFDREAFEQWRESMEEWRERMRDFAFSLRIPAVRARLGVTLQGLTDQLAEYFGLKDRKGALVTRVQEDSPAARAGLRAGDIILEVDGTPVEGPRDVARALRRIRENTVKLRIWRDKKERTVTVHLPERWKDRRARVRVEVLETAV